MGWSKGGLHDLLGVKHDSTQLFSQGYRALGASAFSHLLEIENFVQPVLGQDSLLQNDLSERLVLSHRFLRNLSRVLIDDLRSESRHHHQCPFSIIHAAFLLRGYSHHALLA